MAIQILLNGIVVWSPSLSPHLSRSSHGLPVHWSPWTWTSSHFLGRSCSPLVSNTCASFVDNSFSLVNSSLVSSVLDISFSVEPLQPARTLIPWSGLNSTSIFLQILIEHVNICFFPCLPITLVASWEQKLCKFCSWLCPQCWAMPSIQWCSVCLCGRNASRVPSHCPCDTCCVPCSCDMSKGKGTQQHRRKRLPIMDGLNNYLRKTSGLAASYLLCTVAAAGGDTE